MLKQIYIINTKIIDSIFQDAYLTNILVNQRKMPQIFYKIDLLLEHQNRKFKQF